MENKLLNNVIINILNYLEQFRTMQFGQLQDLLSFNGINLKYIGFILQRLVRLQQNEQLIYFKDLITTEVLARTIKNILVHNVWDCEVVARERDFKALIEQKVDFFLSQINDIQTQINEMQNNKEKTFQNLTFQNLCFIKQIQKYFGFPQDI